MKTRRQNEDEEPFKTVTETEFKVLLNILRARLPRSAHVYNMALIVSDFTEEMEVYSLHGDLTEDAIIMIIFNREDYGQDINLSVPENFQVTEGVKKAFTDSKTIDWQGYHLFAATDRLISLMIFEISTLTYRNSVIFNPNYSYAMSPEEALKYEIEERPGVELKPLDTEIGADFLVREWKYARQNAKEYLKKIISKHISSGIYQDGILVCGCVTNGHGLAGVLNTNEKHRRKGYAFTCMQVLFKELAKKGFIPASTSQQENTYSLALHEKLGMKITHQSDYIFHVPYHTPK